jgi:RNA polymerase sigma-70 factor (ECF subfamily)
MDVQERFVRGDVDAFEALFRRYQPDVFRWVLRIVRDRAAAEDVTVESFWRIYRSRARFDASREFGAWARRIASNAALDHLKRRPKEQPLERDEPSVVQPDVVAGREVREAVTRVMAELPAKYRIVALLAVVEEVPHDAIAQALGISEGTVRIRKLRALRQLRKRLSELGVQP